MRELAKVTVTCISTNLVLAVRDASQNSAWPIWLLLENRPKTKGPDPDRFPANEFCHIYVSLDGSETKPAQTIVNV